jgi:hypothetical protein
VVNSQPHHKIDIRSQIDFCASEVFIFVGERYNSRQHQKENFIMHQTLHRDRFKWLAYLALAFYGYFLNALGLITPFLKDEMRLTYAIGSFISRRLQWEFC